MKKKLLSILLTLVMLVSLVPATAWATGEGHSHDGIEFTTEISNGDELKNLFTIGGSGYLAADIVTDGTLPVTGTVDLCLNGHVIKYDSTGNGSVIKVESGATLNLYDCNSRLEADRTHAGYVDADGLWHLGEIPQGAENCTAKSITGGVITGGNAISGGGVYFSGSGTFNMYGGNIVGNTATYGGGVYVGSSGTFTMTGGTISNNTAITNGGGSQVGEGQRRDRGYDANHVQPE